MIHLYTLIKESTGMTILLTIVLGVLLSWLAGLVLLTDFSIPSKGLPPIRNVLVIFPHADDEAIANTWFEERGRGSHFDGGL